MSDVPSTEFRETMDPHALDIVVDDERIGSLQRYPKCAARVVLSTELPIHEVPISVVAAIVERSQKPD